ASCARRSLAVYEKTNLTVRQSLTAVCGGKAARKPERMSKRERSTGWGRVTMKRTLLVCGFLLLLLAIVLVIASVIGSQRLPLTSSLCTLIGKSNCGLSSEERAILFDIRWPRILLAGAVGMCLATAGAGYQALLRNPLAEPYLLGVSNGAAVGTMTAR